MALNDNAVLQVSTGHFYTAVPGTPCPTDLSAISTPWVEIGHTSLESILSFSSDGGDATTLGTLQAPNLRVTRAARTETMAFILEQWDEESLKLYFGQNMTDISNDADGSLLSVPSSPTPTSSAFLAVLKDGNRFFGIYAPKAELFRGDDASLDDTASLAGLPINVTPLQYTKPGPPAVTNDWAYALTPIQVA
jgi:hypothetical protein